MFEERPRLTRQDKYQMNIIISRTKSAALRDNTVHLSVCQSVRLFVRLSVLSAA